MQLFNGNTVVRSLTTVHDSSWVDISLKQLVCGTERKDRVCLVWKVLRTLCICVLIKECQNEHLKWLCSFQDTQKPIWTVCVKLSDPQDMSSWQSYPRLSHSCCPSCLTSAKCPLLWYKLKSRYCFHSRCLNHLSVNSPSVSSQIFSM